MNYCDLSIKEGNDLSSVAVMAGFAFGHVITENEFIKTNLPQIVQQLVLKSQCQSKFNMKAIHSILAHFGVNTKGLRKHEELRMFMEAAFLHICYRNNVHEDSMYPDLETFVENYGAEFFKGADGKEMKSLLRYRNYMTIAVKYINPEQNRDYLLDLITRLAEGCNVKHIPGSGATLATRNRIDIYRKEGCVRKKARVPRSSHISVAALQPAVAAAPLKRGRSLDEGCVVCPKRGCSSKGDGTKVWMSMADESALLELFTDFDNVEGMELDELDILVKQHDWPELPKSFFV